MIMDKPCSSLLQVWEKMDIVHYDTFLCYVWTAFHQNNVLITQAGYGSNLGI